MIPALVTVEDLGSIRTAIDDTIAQVHARGPQARAAGQPRVANDLIGVMERLELAGASLDMAIRRLEEDEAYGC